MQEKPRLYEFALILHPKPEEEGKKAPKSELIGDVKRILATESEVEIIAARAIPEEYLDRLDEVEIAIRPF